MRRRIAITTCLITAASFQVALSDPSTAGNAHSSGASTGQVQALVMARFAAAESESVARTGAAISGEFHAVSTISAKDAWAVGGDQGHPLIGHWNGRRWKTVSSANIQGSLNGVSAASADDICIFLAEQFRLPHDQDFSRQITKTLHHLHELGLIEKAGWEPLM